MRVTAPAALIGVLLVATLAAATPPQRPNVVILYADNLGYGDLGVQNPESKIATPNLDRLANEGVRFTDAHSSSGICSPSRYALLTGRYHWRRLHDIVHAFGGPVLESERVTLPEMFKEHGYRTACIGKWHLGWDWDSIRRPGSRPLGGAKSVDPHYAPNAFDWSKPVPGGPLEHGFDDYFGDDVPNFPPYAWIENDQLLEAPTVEVDPQPPVSEGGTGLRRGPSVKGWRLDHVMPRLTNRAVEWIEQQQDDGQPFFLYFSWTAPHDPIVPDEEFKGKSRCGRYGDFVQQCDAVAGRILTALEHDGKAKNTIVVFTSDNGPEHYAYQRVAQYGHRSMGPLRGLKRDLWEGGHRVPMIVRWPGALEGGKVSDALIGQIDLYKTLASLANIAVPAEAAEDSLDQSRVLRGGSAVRESLVHNTHNDRYAIRRGSWVLIDTDTPGYNRWQFPKNYPGPNDYEPDPARASLYDLAEDLGQRTNLIASHAEKAEELRALLKQVRGGPSD